MEALWWRWWGRILRNWLGIPILQSGSRKRSGLRRNSDGNSWKRSGESIKSIMSATDNNSNRNRNRNRNSRDRTTHGGDWNRHIILQSLRSVGLRTSSNSLGSNNHLLLVRLALATHNSIRSTSPARSLLTFNPSKAHPRLRSRLRPPRLHFHFTNISTQATSILSISIRINNNVLPDQNPYALHVSVHWLHHHQLYESLSRVSP